MSLFIPPNARATDANSASLSGAQWFFYITGTTSLTPVYTTSARNVEHTNPVVADAGGKFSNIFLNPNVTYRAVLKTSDGSTLSDVDPYSPPFGFTEVIAALQDGRVNVKHPPFNATGDGTTDDTAAIKSAIATLGEGDTLYFPPGDYYVVATGTASTDEAALGIIPEGANVYMEPSAWIKLDTNSGPTDASSPTTNKKVISAFIPGGNNIFQVNVDGQSLAENEEVDTGTWINESFGVRAYGSAPNGIGANSVTVINSQFKNLTYAIESEGGEWWKVLNNRFTRTRLSAVIWTYSDGYDCKHNITANNHFEDIGDCAVAHVQADFPAVVTNECAYNIVANNTARDWCLNTYGGAYNVEPGNNSALQHHIVFIGNTGHHTRTGLAHAVGLISMHGVTDCAIIGNTGQGAYNNVGDFGISVADLSPRRVVIANNVLSQWRTGGIIIDGTTDARVTGNMLVNCGDKSSGNLYGSIVVAANYATTRPVVSGNTVILDSANTNVDATVKAITARGVGLIEGAVIENNDCVGSWGNGIYINGLLAGGRVNGAVLLNNRITRYNTALTGGYAVELLGIDQLTIDGTILTDCSYGYTLNTCARSIVRNGEVKGSATMTGLYDFTSSTTTIVENMRCAVAVTTAVVAAGTTGRWWNDDKVAPTVFANDAAAATAGVPLHAPYWNGTSAVVRMV